MAILVGILLPFFGTMAGAACVFFAKEKVNEDLQRIFLGFAGGVMTAASVWSLLIPAMDLCEGMGMLSFLPTLAGFLSGVGLLLLMDLLVPHLHTGERKREGFPVK